MKIINQLLVFVAVMLTAITASARTHWTCDAHAFQYDMTAYVQLTDGGFPLTDYSDYEIAAFVGDECRGVAQIVDAVKPYGLIRIRSNEVSGEIVIFKVYRYSTNEEFIIDDVSIEFVSQGIEGLPSTPLLLDLPNDYRKGDVNGDNYVDVYDVTNMIDYILGREVDPFILVNADLNGDGHIDVADVVPLIALILNIN